MIEHYKGGDKWDHKRLGEKLWSLAHGQEYVIEITKNRPIRSLSANKYYWGYVLKEMALATGHDAEELHEMFKLKFNAKLIEFPDGTKELIPRGTSEMDVAEFQLYIGRVKAWGTTYFRITWVEAKDVDYLRWSELKSNYDATFNKF